MSEKEMKKYIKINKNVFLIVIGVLFWILSVLFSIGIFGNVESDYLEYYENGNLKYNVSIREGNGTIIFYSEKGKKQEIQSGTFEENNLVNGKIITYYESGKINRNLVGSFKESKLEGVGEMIFYYESGKKQEIQSGTFEENNLKKGQVIFYYENGNKQEIQRGTFDGNNLIDKEEIISYDEEGSIEEINNKSGVFYPKINKLTKKIKENIVWIKYEVIGKYRDGTYFELSGTGSGVIVGNEDNELIIYTNRHVVDCEYNDDMDCFQRISEKISVRTQDGKIHEVDEVSFGDDGIDIAVLTIEISDAKKYAFAYYSDDFNVGNKVIAVGYPSYAKNVVEFSVGEGKISNIVDVLSQPTGNSFRTIESDAYTYFGSSGGGLFDEEGNLIGINTWLEESQVSIAIDFNSIKEQTLIYCKSHSYYAEGNCWEYCDRDEVMGLNSRSCYGLCDEFYCNTEQSSAVSLYCKDAGYVLGSDGYCHPSCGYEYCGDRNAICWKNQCITCSDGELWKDGTCRY